jgi:hypothetical protein
MLHLLSLVLATSVATPTDACTSVSACAFFVNHGDGPGGSAISATGSGFVGRTEANDSSRTTFVAGVYGESLGTAGGPFAGVFGFSASKITGFGVAGQGAYGVFGEGQRYGVLGLASTSNGQDLGVEGYGPGGVLGFAIGDAPGVRGFNKTAGPIAYGVQGIAETGGVQGEGRIGVIATTGTFPDGSTALQLEPTGDALALRSVGTNGLPTASLDGSGNLILAGAVTSNGTPMSAASTPAGTRYTAFGDRAARPLIEDIGEARLAAGSAAVPLERTYASIIDRSKPYLVFVTPENDSKGLYVSSRNAAGFVVRENDNGRSTLMFQYRIVATPADTPDRRLPAAPAIATVSGFVRHVTVPNYEAPSVPVVR